MTIEGWVTHGNRESAAFRRKRMEAAKHRWHLMYCGDLTIGALFLLEGKRSKKAISHSAPTLLVSPASNHGFRNVPQAAANVCALTF